jgi:rhodanese-related sulfurtransferase
MLTRGFKQLLAEANAVIETISVQEAIELVGKPGVTFVDVREGAERQKTGAIPAAVHASRGFLEFQADPESPMHVTELGSGNLLIIYCASGGRSALAAKTLGEMGVENVCNLAGGFAAWQQAGGPVER